MTRVTDAQLWDAYTRMAEALVEVTGSTDYMPTLHVGDHLNKITNKLLVDRAQVWPDGMAGITKRDAYNALRIMISTLAVVQDSRLKKDIHNISDLLKGDPWKPEQVATCRGCGETNLTATSTVCQGGLAHDWMVDEKLFLVCEECGEAFDSLETAQSHTQHQEDTSFYIAPESEAF